MVIEEGRIMGHVQWRDRHGGGAFGGRLMITQRVERLAGAALLVTLGVQGLSSPLAHVALMRSTPDCIEAGLMAASVGMEIHLLSAGPDCVKGSYAPAASYHVVAQAALTVSLTALVLGVLAMILTVGVGLHARQVVRQLRGWVARRLRMVAAATSAIVFQLGQPVMLPVVVRPVRIASRPSVRRGPPSCSC
jgi:hypothetical protein